jgi:hypothetical protein
MMGWMAVFLLVTVPHIISALPVSFPVQNFTVSIQQPE